MRKTDRVTKIVLGVIVSLLVGAILYGIFGPKKINWKDSFAQKETRPFGCYILYQELASLFEGADIQEIKTPVLDQLSFEEFSATTYLFINNTLPFNQYDVDELLRFASAGNQIFLSASEFSSLLEDTLGFFVIQEIISELDSVNTQDSIQLSFTHPDLQEHSFFFSPNRLRTYLDISQNEWIQPLVKSASDKVYAIRIPVGSGSIYICSLPHVFSNFYLIQAGNSQFVNQLFSYLPASPDLWWDEYYKVEQLARTNRRNSDASQNKGFFAYLMEQEAFAWAIWVMLGTILLYALFEIKRTQRMVPVIDPLPNTTLDFTETVGRLYFHSRDHKTVALKRIKIFLNFIRTTYTLKTTEFSTEFIQTLAGKSGLSIEEVTQLCQKIAAIKEKNELSEEDLIELSASIEHFYQQTTRS
ncbi:MAG: DUF4350 domain-containing protein [Bacteroidota bacterium]